MTDMYSISVYLRAVAHVLHYADYIQQITNDNDFRHALVDITSDYLYLLSEEAGKSSEIADNEDCENAVEIKELTAQIEKLRAELAELKPEAVTEEEPEQEEMEEISDDESEQGQEDE